MGWQRFRDRPGATGDAEGQGPQAPDTTDEAFWRSPVGDAARARLRGDRFFQIEVDQATLATYVDMSGSRRSRRSNGATDLLGQIEELGWHLDHVTWWRDNGPAPAPDPAGPDRLRGVYLFRAEAADEAAEHPAEARSPLRHLPTHRRDVALSTSAPRLPSHRTQPR